MNLRILKKLSKRAAPLLLNQDPRLDLFDADGEDHLCKLNVERKHCERMRGQISDIAPVLWRGTPLVDCTSSYDGEFDYSSAWEIAQERALWNVFDYGEYTTGFEIRLNRKRLTPSRVFAYLSLPRTRRVRTQRPWPDRPLWYR